MRANEMNRRGITLIELLVTLAVLSLAVAAIGAITVMNQKQTMENQILTKLQDDMRYTVETIVPFIRMGSALQVETVAGDVTVSVTIPPEVYTPDEYVFRFGFDAASGAVWVREQSLVSCERVAALNVSGPDSQGLVDVELVSVSATPGVQTGLPMTMKTSVMLRNR